MRRALAMLIAAAAGAAVLVGAGARDTQTYRVAAVFSNAAGLIPGQNVEIAGAIVGKVESIRLTPEHRARVEMAVKTGFVPFRADADCEIKPQSLIGEKFVECDPGSPDAKVLRDVGGTPTVPLAQTHAPVDIDLVFAALREPYVNRLSLVVNELGTGLAGRPHDLQLAIRRSAPALQEFDRVLGIVNRDRDLLGRLIDRTDTVLAQVTPRSRDVAGFVARASRVGATVAQRRDALAAGLDRLPPLLAELEPSARSLAGTVRDARPAVRRLREATPSLRDLFADLAPLTDAGRPALSALRSASDEGRSAVKAARPAATRLRAASRLMPHVAEVADAVVTSLKNAGGVEAINTFAWLGTAAMARFDKTSHIIPSYQLAVDTCNLYATKPVEGCSAHWAGSAAAKAAAKKARKQKSRARGRRDRGGSAGDEPASAAPESGGQQPTTPGGQPPSLPKLPDLPPLPGGIKPPQPAGSGPGERDDATQKLLDFLMGK